MHRRDGRAPLARRTASSARAIAWLCSRIWPADAVALARLRVELEAHVRRRSSPATRSGERQPPTSVTAYPAAASVSASRRGRRSISSERVLVHDHDVRRPHRLTAPRDGDPALRGRGRSGARHTHASSPRSRTTAAAARGRPARAPRHATASRARPTSAAAISDGWSGAKRRPVSPSATTSRHAAHPGRDHRPGNRHRLEHRHRQRLDGTRQAHDVGGVHDVDGVRAEPQHADDPAATARRLAQPTPRPVRRRQRGRGRRARWRARLSPAPRRRSPASLGAAPPRAPPRTHPEECRARPAAPREPALGDRPPRRLRSRGSLRAGSRRVPGAPSDSAATPTTAVTRGLIGPSRSC